MEFFLKTEVVKGDIPWLIGLRTLNKVGITVDVANKSLVIKVFGNQRIKGKINETGYMVVKVKDGIKKQSIWWKGGTLEGLVDKDRRKKFVWKLHVQFGHPSKEKLDRLIKEAYQLRSEWEEVREEVFEAVELVTKECDVCTRYRRVPARLIVGMNMARNFNELVAVDLGELEGNKFLVMVGVSSNYCQAV